MIIIKEKVKDLPILIFLMIFNFWAGTVCTLPPKDPYWKKYIIKISMSMGRYKSCWPKREPREAWTTLWAFRPEVSSLWAWYVAKRKIRKTIAVNVKGKTSQINVTLVTFHHLLIIVLGRPIVDTFKGNIVFFVTTSYYCWSGQHMTK